MVVQSLKQRAHQSQVLLSLHLQNAPLAVSKVKRYKVKLEVEAEVEAFDEGDALDYANDIFGIDDEIKNVKVITVKEK